MANVAKDFAQLISQSKSNKTGPYDTQATVKRVEGNTVWVSIPGGIDETPIDKTVNCTAGDKVQVRVSGGRAWITGNASAPPTDDKRANEAKTTAENAQVMAVDAKETAKAVESIAVNANTTATNAQHIAEGVNEHFWHDNTGAHVTEVTQEEWNEPTDPNYHSGGNTLITTQGMAIRNGLTNLAQFGSTGAVIGEVTNGNSRTEISTSGMQIYQRVSGNDVSIANIGYGPGIDSGGGTSDAPYYTLGTRASGQPIGNYSVAEGYNSKASGYMAHAEATSTANGQWAHSEGASTASGGYSHAEGTSTASGGYSHAQGDRSTSSGTYSFASGGHAIASSDYANSIGCYTTADSLYQTVVGKYNLVDSADTYSLIVGNGTATYARSNALTVDWRGNVQIPNDAGYYGTQSDGTTQRVLIGMSPSNNVAVGYDSYSNADGNLNLYGNAVTLNSNTTITSNQTITVGGNPMGLVAEEVLLTDNKTINASSYGNDSRSVAKTGYTPIGIVGMHIQNASSSGTNNTSCPLHSFYLSGTTAYWIVRNVSTSAAKIKVTATVLYVKS